MEHKTALVTGASGGIGSAIARSLADAGLRIALLGRDRDKLEQLRVELATARQSVAIACDATDRPGMAAAIETVEASLGSIDILVCGAGINVRDRSLRSLNPDDWDRVIATNLTGAFNAIHFTLPGMRQRGSGLVIQLSSLSGLRASHVSGVAYSVSKFGQSALGMCIGREERGRGIRSTVICAGEVNTPFLDIRATRMGASDDGRREGILQPEDVAAAVLFVASLPKRAHIPEIVIKPTIDDFA